MEFSICDSFSVEDLKQGLLLTKKLGLQISDSKPLSDADLLTKYKELKVLSQYLESFDLSEFNKLNTNNATN